MGLAEMDSNTKQTFSALQVTLELLFRFRLFSFRRDDLVLTIDWTNVTFTQDSVQLFNSRTDQCPRAQTLFRTNFENQTNNEQNYTVRTERTSSALFKYILTDTLSKTPDSSFVFRLPDSCVQTAGGIPREQSFPFGRDL
jgi:hypothetical protein